MSQEKMGCSKRSWYSAVAFAAAAVGIAACNGDPPPASESNWCGEFDVLADGVIVENNSEVCMCQASAPSETDLTNKCVHHRAALLHDERLLERPGDRAEQPPRFGTAVIVVHPWRVRSRSTLRRS
jgi:hypothetical protein